MGPDSKFKAEMIEYLESCHVGQFCTGSLDEVREKVNQDVQSDGYINPVESLPKQVSGNVQMNADNVISAKKIRHGGMLSLTY